MTVVENIRRLDADGVPRREIARRLGVSRDSVTKYAGVADFSPAAPALAARPGSVVLAGLEPVVHEWLTGDARRPRKQRHTAQRVFDRLVDEHGYAGSYSPVQRLVKQFRAEHRSRAEGFLGVVVAARSGAGRFRSGRSDHRGGADAAASAGGDLPVLEHPVRAGLSRGNGRVRLPRAAPDLRARRGGPAGAGAGLCSAEHNPASVAGWVMWPGPPGTGCGGAGLADSGHITIRGMTAS